MAEPGGNIAGFQKDGNKKSFLLVPAGRPRACPSLVKISVWKDYVSPVNR
jgi:hypothetical protein